MAERDPRFGGNLELANIGEVGISSLAKRESDWHRANEEYNRFQIRANEPGARFAELKHYRDDKAENPNWWHGMQNAFPLGNNQWGVSRGSASMGMPSQPASEYYQGMRELNRYLMDDKKNIIRQMILGPNYINDPSTSIQAGITNKNLNGYKAIKAMSHPLEWLGDKYIDYKEKKENEEKAEEFRQFHNLPGSKLMQHQDPITGE